MNRFEQKLKKNLRSAEFAAGFYEADAELTGPVLSIYANETPKFGTSSVATASEVESWDNNLSYNNLMPVWLVYMPQIQFATALA